ncbi:hypothetical protein ALMP_76420 [Streptomyces sp. A012304]|nr:hypothetical protein ALMP_76420 [Streptomyces sp. A012304]
MTGGGAGCGSGVMVRPGPGAPRGRRKAGSGQTPAGENTVFRPAGPAAAQRVARAFTARIAAFAPRVPPPLPPRLPCAQSYVSSAPQSRRL